MAEQHAGALLEALKLWQTVQGMLRLTIEGYFKPEREHEIPPALTHALAKAGDCKNIEALKALITETAERAFQVFEEIVGTPSD